MANGEESNDRLVLSLRLSQKTIKSQEEELARDNSPGPGSHHDTKTQREQQKLCTPHLTLRERRLSTQVDLILNISFPRGSSPSPEHWVGLESVWKESNHAKDREEDGDELQADTPVPP